MRLEDVKVGMHLRDPKGNVWEILNKSVDTGIPYIHAKCTEFVQPIGVMPTYTVDTEAKACVGRMLLINKRHLIVAPDSVIEQFKDYFAIGHQCINVVTGLNKSKVLRFVTQEQYDNVEVTLESLEPIPEPQHLTRDNIRIGMNVQTASGMQFSVRGYSDDGVLLRGTLQSPDVAGSMKQISADSLVEWSDSSRPIPANLLTTKDFIIVE